MQVRAIDEAAVAFAAGRRAVLVTSPTGTGKGRVIEELVKYYAAKKWSSVLYTNRKLLMEQLLSRLEAAGIACGVRAAGYEPALSRPVQASSIPTEATRTLDEYARWPLHGTGTKDCLVVIDEAHANAGPTARELIARHLALGHRVLGLTATPVDLGDLYEHLVVAGTVSEGRACGALVRCDHFGCDEPDLRKLKKPPIGRDYAEPQLRKAYPKTPQLVGRVIDWFRRLNPEMRPSILFACGVPESVWFAQEFSKAGIPAAHIDGEEVWVDGEFYRSDAAARAGVLERSRNGDLRVLCNRFVLREGIDCPWLSHGILAAVFGSLQSYLQSGGRLLRAFPGLECVTLQDHGGSWWRHGSLNADREWRLDDTAATVRGEREEQLRAKKFKEPYLCPKCYRVLSTKACPGCGLEVPPGVKSRAVVMADGTLTEMRGDVYRPRRVDGRDGGKQRWVAWYMKALRGKGGLTFMQAMALYARENDWGWPDPGWPYTPRRERDLFKAVRDVPGEELNR